MNYIKSLDQHILDAGEILRLLGEDVQFAQDHLAQDFEAQFWRRTFVRSIAALVEGQLFSMKQMLISLAPHRPHLFSAADMSILAEETYELDDSGKVRVQPKFLQMSRNLKFVFTTYSKTLSSPAQPDFRSDGWRSFLRFVEIRNRITHPKRIADWDLTDPELTEVQTALNWYMEEVWSLLTKQQFLEAALLKTAAAIWQPKDPKRKKSK